MAQHFTVAEYLETDETSRRRELVHGELREPPAPTYGHQAVVTRLVALFHTHVERHRLGHVCVSPLDVILDAERDLILQPDIVFVSSERAGIIRDRIWGAPDLVVEVLSPSNRGYDRMVKRELYERLGVAHYWIVDPGAEDRDPQIVALELDASGAYTELTSATAGPTFTVERPFPVSVRPADLLHR